MDKNGNTVDFINLILDGKKKGETRTHNHLTRKPAGIIKDGLVYGKIKLSEPFKISKDSPEYNDAMIEGTDYNINGDYKWYYPITVLEDYRENPRPVKQDGNYARWSIADDEAEQREKFVTDKFSDEEDGGNWASDGFLEFENAVKSEINDYKTNGKWYGTHIQDAYLQRNSFYSDPIREYLTKNPDIDRLFKKYLSTIDDQIFLENLLWFPVKARWQEQKKYAPAVSKYNKAIRNRQQEIYLSGKEKVGTNIGIEHREYKLSELHNIFKKYNDNPDIDKLFDKVYNFAKNNGVIAFGANKSAMRGDQVGEAIGRRIKLKKDWFNDEYIPDSRKAKAILHELIHTCTSYAITFTNDEQFYGRIPLNKRSFLLLHFYYREWGIWWVITVENGE